MKTLLLLLLITFPSLGSAQSSGTSKEQTIKPEESFLTDRFATSFVIDNSRTKVGRDFYDLFYQHWAAPSAEADTAQVGKPAALSLTMANWVIVNVEEIPSPGTSYQILITIDGDPVWQQFVQARYDMLEANAINAVETVRESLTSYQGVQQQLSSQDSRR